MTTKELIKLIRGGKEHYMPCYRLDERACNEILIKLESLQKFEDRFNLIYDSETDSLIEELIVYKKAFEMACDKLSEFSSPSKKWYSDFYLNHAQKELEQ